MNCNEPSPMSRRLAIETSLYAASGLRLWGTTVFPRWIDNPELAPNQRCEVSQMSLGSFTEPSQRRRGDMTRQRTRTYLAIRLVLTAEKAIVSSEPGKDWPAVISLHPLPIGAQNSPVPRQCVGVGLSKTER